jgi:hypothetical protein
MGIGSKKNMWPIIRKKEKAEKTANGLKTDAKRGFMEDG